MSERVLARVNGTAITERDVAFALERSAGSDLREALAFLIDQELLVQRGVAIGLLDSDLAVRKTIVMAVIETVVAEVVRQEPSEEELRAFYGEHRALFTLPTRLHLQYLFVGENGDRQAARARAEQAAAAIAQGLPFSDARDRYGEGGGVLLPDTPLPVHVLRRYLGPTLARIALTLAVGETSPPVRSPQGYYILHLVAAYPEEVQPYATVKQAVKAEYWRRKRDEALQRHIDRLRRSATLVLSPHAPAEHQRKDD